MTVFSALATAPSTTCQEAKADAGATATRIPAPATFAELDAGLAKYTRLRAAEVLDDALESTTKLMRSRMLVAEARRAADILGSTSTIGQELRGARATTDEDDLERMFERAIGDLRFEPTMEAPVPEAWPPTAPIDRVVLKSYPKYRMAKTPARGGQETTPFWKLFGHIKNSDIAMTAPVQMDDAADGSDAQMAFLYRVEADGPLGRHHGVDVVDVEPGMAISIGSRGYRMAKDVEQLTKQLERWLEKHAAHLERTGPKRVMGYNGPGMRGDRRFFEVEIPVRWKPAAATKESTTAD